MTGTKFVRMFSRANIYSLELIVPWQFANVREFSRGQKKGSTMGPLTLLQFKVFTPITNERQHVSFKQSAFVH